MHKEIAVREAVVLQAAELANFRGANWQAGRRFNVGAVVAYATLHIGCLGVFYTGVSVEGLWVLFVSFLLRGFGVSIIYHRYFAHRSFRTSRIFQFIMALYGALTVLGGPLWWAQTHRDHHKHADTPADIHSPFYQGFIYSHCGWFLDLQHRSVDLSKIPDLAAFPELVLIERWKSFAKSRLYLRLLLFFWIDGARLGIFSTRRNNSSNDPLDLVRQP